MDFRDVLGREEAKQLVSDAAPVGFAATVRRFEDALFELEVRAVAERATTAARGRLAR